MKLILGLLLAIVSVAVLAYQAPPATFEAKSFTSWDKKKIQESRRGNIYVPLANNDFVSTFRLDLVGDCRTRGFAQGALLWKEIVEFTGPKLDKFYADQVLNLDISQYPEQLQEILKVLQVKGAAAAPAIFKQAMSWVWDNEVSFVPQPIIDELEGMAAGVCSSMTAAGLTCDTAEWSNKLKEINMLPELIRMACTAFGAWGKATPTGNGLVQLRALDFGSGPFANYTVIAVHRNDPNNIGNAFVTVSFPGFVGVVTGVSQAGVGVSEKVWMTYDKRSLQPGNYHGEADIFVLRDILEYSRSKAEAEQYMAKANRTWAMWVGVGDHATKTFDLVGYQEGSAIAYNDVTAPAMTGQPYLESIAYVDKHPQPSGEGPTGTLPTALKDFYGNITCENVKVITQAHQTGDLHIASYDFSNNEMYVAIGRINHDGNYGPDGGDNNAWKAYNRPHLKFNLNELWSGV